MSITRISGLFAKYQFGARQTATISITDTVGRRFLFVFRGFCNLEGDSSVFVLPRTGHFEYSPVHNSININARNFILHLHGSCHMCFNV